MRSSSWIFISRTAMLLVWVVAVALVSGCRQESSRQPTPVDQTAGNPQTAGGKGPVVVPALANNGFAADKVDITGRWKCQGTNLAGQTYGGAVEITKDGDAYRVAWSHQMGAETHSGVGLVEGDVLGVAYEGGVVVYKIEKDKLTGKWTLNDFKGKVLTETLTK